MTKASTINKNDLFISNDIYKVKPAKDIVQISNSKLGLFNTCYLQFFFRYLTDFPVKPTVWPATLLGEALHKVVELSIEQMNSSTVSKIDKLKKEIKSNVSSFKEVYDIMLEEKKHEFKKSRGYDYNEFVEKGEKYRDLLINFMINYFYDYDSIQTEREFKTMYTDDIELIGYIDLLGFKNNEFSIFDLKITKDSYKYYFMDWDYNFQSLIYEYLSYKDNVCKTETPKWASDFSFIIVNHEEKTLFFKQKFLEQPKDVKEYFSNIDKAINNVVNFVRQPKFIDEYKPSAVTCKWCNYKEICPLNKNK